jgi:hypothetical protein
MWKKLAKNALGILVGEFVGEAARKCGEVFAERVTAKYRLKEVELVEVEIPKTKRKKK